MAREIVAGEEKVEVRVPESSVHRGAPDIEDGVGVDGREEGAQKEKEKEKPKDPPRDLYTLLRDHRESDELLNRFWEEVTTVPDWVCTGHSPCYCFHSVQTVASLTKTGTLTFATGRLGPNISWTRRLLPVWRSQPDRSSIPIPPRRYGRLPHCRDSRAHRRLLYKSGS